MPGMVRALTAIVALLVSSRALAQDSAGVAAPDTTLAAAMAPRVPSDSTLRELQRLFKHQTVARVHVAGHRYMLDEPKLTPQGITYRFVMEPSHLPAGTLPALVTWAGVDSLLLRRTHATGMGASFGIVLGLLGGFAGYALASTENTEAGLAGAVLLGGAGAALGFLGGGFLGGFVQYWVQVYPTHPPEPDWRGF